MRESGILKHIFSKNTRLPLRVVIPPGDDMGAVRVGRERLLVTVDQLIDRVHFRLGRDPLRWIGRKAMTRNLSDVAAMAAKPVAAVAAAALPRSMSAGRARQLFDAMRQTGERFDCPLIGGDLSIHDGPLTITVTVIATPAGIEPIRRDGARIGDVIAVTGRLGRAWRKGKAGGPHLTFEPRVGLARRLARWPGVKLHSMIDISDGLAVDLRHICQMSGVGAEIDPQTLPCRAGANPTHALNDGEDYELLFTLSARSMSKLPRKLGGVPITPIGRIIGERRLLLTDGTKREPIPRAGWEHKS